MKIKACGTCKDCPQIPTSPVSNTCSVLQDQVTKEIWHDWAHVFVNGTGLLNAWKWPEIEGLSSFKGDLMHSANWNHDVELENKTIGVIGTGSTSVQIIPNLQKIAKKVKVFMRSPTWISPPFARGLESNSSLRELMLTLCHRPFSYLNEATRDKSEHEAIYIHRRG